MEGEHLARDIAMVLFGCALDHDIDTMQRDAARLQVLANAFEDGFEIVNVFEGGDG